jgi:hypothetical protein
MIRSKAWIAVGSILLGGCDGSSSSRDAGLPVAEVDGSSLTSERSFHVVDDAVPIRAYFEYLDSVVASDSTLRGQPDAEHLLVRANPALIERLEDTDYYRMKDRGIESKDPQAEIALRRGDTLWIPSAAQIEALRDTFAATVLDLNIPEFTLRILKFGVTRYSFPVRVGQNRSRFLEMAGREARAQATRPGRMVMSTVRLSRRQPEPN